MASGIKWIKICTDIFDDEKILLIESMPDADSVIVIWFKLLCLAGKQNNDGVFSIDGGFPYTVPMLATIFRRKESTVERALKTFENFNMVEIIDDTITIPNWQKHQNTERMRKIREDTRQRNIRYRERQKALVEQGTIERDASRDAFVTNKEIRKKKEDKEPNDNMSAKADAQPRQTVDYAQTVDSFNRICTSLPKVQSVNDRRKKAIRSAAPIVEKFGGWEKLFAAVERSDFLTGRNGSWNGCGFDWILKPSNLTKILEGNYANSTKRKDAKNYDNAVNVGQVL